VLEKGVIVAGYRVEGVLGKGGMGVVYEATQLSLERTVALKLISTELGSDPGFRERFRREGRTQAAMDHPHIVPVHEAGESEYGLFIAMRLIPGRNLKHFILAGELDARRTALLLSQVAGALDTAHAAGLIHRDIKPSNVLVHAERDHAYLADFGATKVRSGVSLTATGQLVGTPDYMAPEQILGEPATERTDIYALGGVLFECFTGRIPYERDADLAVLYAHLNEPPPSVTQLVPDLPAVLDHVIGKAMAKRPEERYATAGELLSDVERALGRDRLVTTVNGPATVAATTLPAVTPDEETVRAEAPARPAAPAARVTRAPITAAARSAAVSAFVGALALLAAFAIPFTPSFEEWNVFAVLSPIEAGGVALAVVGVAWALLANRLDVAVGSGLLAGFATLTSVGAVALLSFAVRRHGTAEVFASVLVLLGALAIVAAAALATRLVRPNGAGGRAPVALALGAVGAALSFVSLNLDYDGFSSLYDELVEGESAEFFFTPAVAIAAVVAGLVMLASLMRPRIAAGLLLAVGTQSALHYVGLTVAAALAVGERGEVRSGGFVGLVGALLVVAAGGFAYGSSRRSP
jgi:hypothetical protein